MNAIRRAGIAAAWALGIGLRAAEPPVLPPEPLRAYVARFNAQEDEPVVNLVPNAGAAAWLEREIPRFACPEPELEEIYHFRWWAMRKHLRRTAEGAHVFTEFINRAEPVSSALGHHLREGRWLHDASWQDDYVRWWLRGTAGQPHPRLRAYSQWLAEAVWQRALVTGDRAFAVGLLDDLVADFRRWEADRRLSSGLFWQYDVRDAMEESISGSRTKKNVRPTINSYMFGNARALAAIAQWAGRTDLAAEFAREAERIRALTLTELWDPAAAFFCVKLESGGFSGAREAIGFIPWYFHLPPPDRGYEAAWAQFADPAGFRAPFGITTAERRHPQFRSHGTGTCEWDGAVWPFATSQTLVALANVLRDYPQSAVTRADYLDALRTYARSHRMNGKPYIGEYLDETTGAWLKGDHPRSRWYHHSTFADLVIGGLAGLRPRDDDTVELHPLLPPDAWEWFALDHVRYRGRILTIVWDRDGRRFGKGAGLRVWADGREIAHSPRLERLAGTLPPRP